jgi:hypothetical protein
LSWGYLWAISACIRAILVLSWGHLGVILGCIGAVLGPSWAMVGHLDAILGACCGYIGTCSPDVERRMGRCVTRVKNRNFPWNNQCCSKAQQFKMEAHWAPHRSLRGICWGPQAQPQSANWLFFGVLLCLLVFALSLWFFRWTCGMSFVFVAMLPRMCTCP